MEDIGPSTSRKRPASRQENTLPSKIPRKATSAEIDRRVSEYFGYENSADFGIRLGHLFLFLVDGLDLDDYEGGESERLLKVFRMLILCLPPDQYEYAAFIEPLIMGQMPEEILLNPRPGHLGPEPVLFKRIVDIFLIDKKEPMSAEFIDGVFEEWREFAEEAIRTLSRAPVRRRSPLVQYPVDRRELESDYVAERVEFVGKIFQDDRVKKDFIDIVSSIPIDEPIYPSGSFCAPSGSGKTTFAQHLCCEEYPAIYGLFNFMEGDTRPPVEYRPFLGISRLLKSTAAADIDYIRSLKLTIRNDLDTYIAQIADDINQESAPGSATESRFSGDDNTFWQHFLNSEFLSAKAGDPRLKLKFVGCVVELFSDLFRLKLEFPNKAWLELQCSISSTSFEAMTISQGRDAIMKLRSLREYDPLMLFLDECSLRRGPFISNADDLRKRFKLVRNICRCLGVVVVFSGTDARASNLISAKGSVVRRNVHSFIFTTMPSYDKQLLKDRYTWLEVLEQVENLQLVDENPMNLFHAAMNTFLQRFKMRKQGNEYIKDADPRSYNGTYYAEFSRAQMLYMCAHSWEDVAIAREGTSKILVRQSSHNEEIIVNGHLGYLFAYPSKPSAAYTTLSAGKFGAVYSRDQTVPFVPKSVFTTFNHAPLTGLGLFGLSDQHKSIVGYNNTRISVLDAFLLQFKKSSAGRRTSGTNLERLFDCCAIVASRSNGITGCSVLQFVRSLIQELSPISSDSLVELGCSEDSFPWNGNGPNSPAKIPLLSPMAMGGWNLELAVLLKKLDPHSCLGVYRSTKRNDRCDGVGYFFDPDEPFISDLTKAEMVGVLDKLGDKYPRPLNAPIRGHVRKIMKYPSRVAFAAECKQHQTAINLEVLRGIVRSKFMDPDSEFKNCDLFFLVANKFVAVKDRNGDPKIAMDNVVFWYLVRQKGNGEPRFILKMLPVPAHRTDEARKRNVILISLAVIWGSEFSVYQYQICRVPEQ